MKRLWKWCWYIGVPLGLASCQAMPAYAQTPTDACGEQTQARFPVGQARSGIIEFGRDSLHWWYVIPADSIRGRCVLRKGTPPVVPPSPPPSPPPAPPPAPPPSPPNPPPAGTVLWYSDFSDGLAKWPIVGGEPLTVVDGSVAGFPAGMPALRVYVTGARNGYALARVPNGLPIPAVGSSYFIRWYFYAGWPDGLTDAGTHPIQDGNAASTANWAFNPYHNNGGAGRWQPSFWFGNGSQRLWQLTRFEGPILQKRVAYRFELEIARRTATMFVAHVRVYQGDALVASNNDFTGVDSQGRITLAHDSLLAFKNVNEMGGLNAGLNDIDPAPARGSPSYPFLYGYQGGFAVCASWCGPWSPATR